MAHAPALPIRKRMRRREIPGGLRFVTFSCQRRLRTGDGAVRFWQKGGGFDRNVRDMEEFRREVRYIHRNPVTRGLVERPEDWKWRAMVDGDAGGRGRVRSAAGRSEVMGKVARLCVSPSTTDPKATKIAKPISVARIPIISMAPAPLI